MADLAMVSSHGMLATIRLVPAVVLLAGLSAGCSSAPSPAGRESSPRIELMSADAEVWAFHKRVAGRLHGAVELESCGIERDGRWTPAGVLGRTFTVEVELASGVNVLHARCRTTGGRTLRSQAVTYRVRIPDRPIAHAEVQRDGSRIVLDASRSRVSESEPAPLSRFEWWRHGASVPSMRIGEGVRLVVESAAADAEAERYSVRVTDARGREDHASAKLGARGAPDWLEASVAYGVLPPLFGTAGLRDVAAALDRLGELGVNVLWFAPIFAAPEGDFGYAVVDYFQVRSDYGTAADLGALVQAAHARGMKVLLDLPANHTSDHHRYYRQALRLGPRSHYYGFYDRGPDGRATHYFDWTHLPNLEFSSSEVGRFMLEAARHWVEVWDVDGYRVDAAWGVRQRNPDYWPQLRAELERVEPDILLVAEASARDPYYLQHGFDVAYDWTHELGRHAWGDVFGAGAGIARRLNAAVQATPGDPRRVMRFLNNNDTGQRFITRHGEPMTRVATAALLTLPGLPCLYSFDEVGAEFQPYEELAPIRTARPELREFHRRWIGLRRRHPALASEVHEVLHVGEHDEGYAYVRGRGADALLVVLNFSAEPLELTLPAPWPTPHARDVLSGEVWAVQAGRLTLRVPGWFNGALAAAP